MHRDREVSGEGGIVLLEVMEMVELIRVVYEQNTLEGRSISPRLALRWISVPIYFAVCVQELLSFVCMGSQCPHILWTNIRS